MGGAPELEVVGIGKRGEPCTKWFLVGAAEGVVSGETGEVDVLSPHYVSYAAEHEADDSSHVVQDHDIADAVLRVQASGGIGHDYGLDSEQLHHADRKCDFLDGVAFVETVLYFRTMLREGERELVRGVTYCVRPTITTTGVFFCPRCPKTSFPAWPTTANTASLATIYQGK